MSQVIRIEDQAQESRFARFDLISWWDQKRLSAARVLVIGAGAIGNEVIKNLALLGIGRVFIADLDLVENSNLSRSVLFRYEDCGRAKAQVAADRAREIYPQLKTQAFKGNIVYDLGLGIYRWADVVIGGLDNREARVAINQSAARVGRPWIDGAIERLDGVARVFNAATGPCYECTMNANDWKMLEARRSCALLTRDQMLQGHVPTTPTTASVIAGIQCQEAVKQLHGLETLAGSGFIFEGLRHQSYTVTYTRKPDCPAHDAFEQVQTLPWRSSQTTVEQALEQVRQDLGPRAILEFNHELLLGLRCDRCNQEEPLLASLGKVSEKQGRCPRCGEHRAPITYHSIDDKPDLMDRTLEAIGVPPWDIVTGRAGMTTRHYELSGDRGAVLGELDSGEDEVILDVAEA